MPNDSDTLKRLLLELLDDWGNSVTTMEIHRRAEELLREWGSQTHPRNSEASITTEALIQLDILNQQLITRDDIPAIRRFLETPQGRELDGWRLWESYWSEVDLEERATALHGDPAYAT